MQDKQTIKWILQMFCNMGASPDELIIEKHKLESDEKYCLDWLDFLMALARHEMQELSNL